MNIRFTIVALVIITVVVMIFATWSIAPVVGNQSGDVSNTKILARDGTVLYEVADAGRGLQTIVPLNEIPHSFQKAVLAAEDSRFFEHRGVDRNAVARAMWSAVTEGRFSSGASTIEMQLVKNIYFRGERRTLFQKLREMLAAGYWSRKHQKEETLERYLNTVFLGNRTFGVDAASRQYFHKSASDLSLPESALLAGIIAAPSAYDPFSHWDEARERQQYVLARMFEEGMITADQHDSARVVNFDVFPPRHSIRAPHFVFRVLEELEERYPNIRSGGYVVQTTLDSELQEIAERSVKRRLETLADDHVTNASTLVLDPRTGEVLAYVGSAEYFDSAIQGQVDMVKAKRQPGSALKPFLYFAAFLRGFTPATVIADLPVRFETAEGKSYYPKNYNYRYFGPVSIRDALGSSLNIPAVKVLDQIGLSTFVGVLSRFGITFPEDPNHYGLGIVLGGGEASLWDVTHAYADLARSGHHLQPRIIHAILDSRGNILLKNQDEHPKPLFEDRERAAQASALVSDIMSDRLARIRSFGESNLLDLGKPVAVKTGTTKDFRDNLAFGYTPEFVLGVWVGNADNTPMQGISGITGAVPIWHDIMKHATNRNDIVWPEPEGIVEREICITSGLLATDICPKSRVEKFIAGTEPTDKDTWYGTETIDAKSGLLATAACSSQTLQKIFLRPPSEYAAWLASVGYETPPDRDCEGNVVVTNAKMAKILSPIDGDEFVIDQFLDDSAQKIPFIAGGGTNGGFRWTLNGEHINAEQPIYLWNTTPGDYVLALEGAAGEVRFRVR